MLLSQVAEKLSLPFLGESDPDLCSLTEDSRKVTKGSMFAAVSGLNSNGREYIDEARKKGMAALLISEPDIKDAGPRIVVPENCLRAVMSRASRLIYGCPDTKMKLVAMSGTNGKTSSTYLLEDVLNECQLKTGVIGTVNFRWPGETREAPNTTPEGPLLYQTLSEMEKSGCLWAVMEVSSHALDLGRIEGLFFDAALFTNLSRDHLDYHGDMDSYFKAKEKLYLRHLKENGNQPKAAINIDDLYGLRLMKSLGSKALGFGLGNEAQVRGTDIKMTRSGLSLRVKTPKGTYQQKSKLLGAFNVRNILGIWALGLILDLSPECIEKGLGKSQGAPGRLERVGLNDEFLVLVDYAHSPGALYESLNTLKELGGKKLWVVFGCGGDRDRGKRPLMAEAAGKLADRIILTSDNPRTEDPLAIIEEAARGLLDLGLKPSNSKDYAQRGDGFIIEPDRQKAIGLAVKLLEPGDILLVAGKGHENYQILGRTKIHFDDREEVLQALKICNKD